MLALRVYPVALRRSFPHAHARVETVRACRRWAISVHKSQGMTIPFALYIDFRRMFASGQAYTALSRTTDLSNVQICNFSAFNRGLRADEKVVKFYETHFPTSPPTPSPTPSPAPLDLLNLSSEDEDVSGVSSDEPGDDRVTTEAPATTGTGGAVGPSALSPVRHAPYCTSRRTA